MTNADKRLMASRYREFARDAAQMAVLNPAEAETHWQEARDHNAIADSFETPAEAFARREPTQ